MIYFVRVSVLSPLQMYAAVLLLLLVVSSASLTTMRITPTLASYLVGSGIADMTGQITEIGFMGYASFAQKGSGLHTRMYARAFIIAEEGDHAAASSQHNTSRFVYVSMDFCMGFQTLKYGIIEQLTERYGFLYTDANVILSGTHTHSTPGGIGATVLVDVTTLGFSRVNYNAAVQGVVKAIQRAHESLQPVNIRFAAKNVNDGNINRGLAAYLNDPPQERSRFKYNTDHLMTVLRFDPVYNNTRKKSQATTPPGLIAFYAVHGTSMNNTNTLVSADNKGRASTLYEQYANPNGTFIGEGTFVAAFGQANEGDVSPNTAGASCPDGTPCDLVHSTCDGKVSLCTGKGPGKSMFESTRIIAEKQFDTAKALYEDEANLITVRDGIRVRHEYVNMQNVLVRAEFARDGEATRTCRAALGYGFAGGTTDGPGSDFFEEGVNKTNPFWNWVTGFIAHPTAEQIKCQHPKPILIDAGMTKPMEWVPYILPIQLVQVGQLFIAAVPGEFTTMSGRRLRATITKQIVAAGGPSDAVVLIAGLSNSYSHYIATHEEYEIQRYAAASTLYGPNTLGAYQQLFGDMAFAMVQNKPAPAPDGNIQPADMRNRTFSYIAGVVVDGVPKGKHFGSVNIQPKPMYTRGEVVTVQFWGASPRNDLRLGGTYLTVEFLDGKVWKVVRRDANWDTRLHWKRVGMDQSLITVEWLSGAKGALPYESGIYRIRHFGTHKTLLQQLIPYVGVSNEFVMK